MRKLQVEQTYDVDIENELTLYRMGFDAKGAKYHRVSEFMKSWQPGDYALVELTDGSVLSWIVGRDGRLECLL